MKLLIISIIIFTSALLGEDKISKAIIKFSESQIRHNPNIKLNNVSIRDIHKVDNKWKAYILKLDIVYQGKDVSVGDVIFSDGKLLTKDFIDIKTSQSIKSKFSSLFSDKFYHKDNLVSGSYNSKHKVAVFSDPMCPYCQQVMPDLVKHAKKNPKDIALYYYHFPLVSIHPSVEIASRAMIVAQKRGIKDVFLKVYSDNMSHKLSKVQVLEKVNDLLGLDGHKKITMKDIEQEDIINAEERDVDIANELLINGTPTMYVDGVKDDTRMQYLKFGRK